MKSFKAIFRRGQKLDGQNTADNISRTSSITNLEAEGQKGSIGKGGGGGGGRPKKSASRDRLDKLGESKKNDKKSITKNNNKLESGDSPYPSIDSLQEEDLVQLKKQLQEMAQEKSNLALQLGEHKGQLNILQKEIQKLKSFQEESNSKVEYLTEENTMLRNRLRDVSHSPLSDNEKQQLLFDSHRHHSSAPASIATNLVEDSNNGADTTCTTPDWDKHSSSNVSEVSVACLQDKINQMQETHYSTNEELQATLQELTDLQRQLTELQQENERLNEEKTLMMESLCRQTDRLTESRSEVESLKQALYREKDDAGQFESIAEREQKMVDLLKTAQEERETLMSKLEQMNGELLELRASLIEKEAGTRQLSERVNTLECTLKAKHSELKRMDIELIQSKDQCNGKQIEINRLTDLLDNAKTKIIELEQDRALSDKSELDEMLDNARKEKDALESEVAHLKEQLAISRNETDKLKEQVSILQEEVKVTRNNAKTTQSDLEYKCEKILKEKGALGEQLQEFQEAINELQVQSQCQLEDKRQLSAVLSETQRNLSEAERKNLNLENELEDLKKIRAEENEEWEKFQSDLLTSVRVANDFKTEAQQELQRMILENKACRDRERQLRAEIEKLKGRKKKQDNSTEATLSKSSSSNKENQTMDIFFKRPNKNKAKTKTIVQPKTDIQIIKPIKRRDRKSTAGNRSKSQKTLSVEEEVLLQSLDDWYQDIDKDVPDELLTEEQKVIRKLKAIYEDENLKTKPIAHKPKDQLAISKPLLDSVLCNPKLKEIIINPNVRTINDVMDFEKEMPEIRGLIQSFDRSSKAKSADTGVPHVADWSPKILIIGRSYSYDENLCSNKYQHQTALYRTVEAEDLTQEGRLKLPKRVSSILPSDSVSNLSYRSSSRISVGDNVVTCSTLDRIIAGIPENCPQIALTKEQTFALKLKAALDEAERKHTLKKLKNARSLPISRPLKESVLMNQSLKEIVDNAEFMDLMNSDHEPSSSNTQTLRQSKSLEDLSFTFEPNECAWRFTSSSTDTLTSAEFNVETGNIAAFNFDNYQNVNFKRFSSFFSAAEDNMKENDDPEFDSLTYRETTQLKRRDLFMEAEDLSKEDAEITENKFPDHSQEASIHESGLTHKDIYEKLDDLRNLINKDRQPYTPNSDQRFSYDFSVKANHSKANHEEDGKITAREIGNEDSKSDAISSLEKELTNVSAMSKKERIASLKRDLMKDTFENYKEEMLFNDVLCSNATDLEDSLSSSRKHFLEDQVLDSEPKHQLEDSKSSLNVICSDDCVDYDLKMDKSIFLPYENFMDKIEDEIDANYEVEPIADTEEGYDYRQILRENRYGVISPLNLRMSYQHVVKEFKQKYEKEEDVDTFLNDDCDTNIDNQINFYNFFNIHSNIKINSTIEAVDNDNEAIAESYDSQLIRVEDIGNNVVKNHEQFDENVNLISERSLNESVTVLPPVEETESESEKELKMHRMSLAKFGFEEINSLVDDFIEKERNSSFQYGNNIDFDESQETATSNIDRPENIAIPSSMFPIPAYRFKGRTKDELKLIRLSRSKRFSSHLSYNNADDLRKAEEIGNNGENIYLYGNAREEAVDKNDDKMRKSLSMKSDRKSQVLRRKVKSVAKHFERLSLKTATDAPENLTVTTNTESKQLSNKSREKPRPMQRKINQVAVKAFDNVSDIDKDAADGCHHLKLKKMTETEENFSDYDSNSIIDVNEVPELYENSNLPIVSVSKAKGNEKHGKLVVIKKSEKCLDNILMKEESYNNMASDGLLYGASVSTIAVAGKNETLDLTQLSGSDIELQHFGADESHLNLFHLDTNSYENSRLEVGEGSESKKNWDDFLKNRTDSSSDEETQVSKSRIQFDKRPEIGECSSKPKVIDFVPLDEGTKPFFVKDSPPDPPPTYDTLERETAFHVLATAAATAEELKKKNNKSSIEGHIEHNQNDCDTSDSNRSSFRAAKKVFEALEEANAENKDKKSI